MLRPYTYIEGDFYFLITLLFLLYTSLPLFGVTFIKKGTTWMGHVSLIGGVGGSIHMSLEVGQRSKVNVHILPLVADLGDNNSDNSRMD